MIEYLLKWKDYPEDQSTWEHAGQLENCSDIMDKWKEKKNKQKEEEEKKKKERELEKKKKRKQELKPVHVRPAKQPRKE